MTDIERFKEQHVLVVGDMMVDKYVFGTVERISPEAPVPVLRQSRVERKLGGTGNVILNLLSLGAAVRAVGRVGKDEDGSFFRETLVQNGAEDSFIFSEGNTIVKTRVVASNHQFIRIDEETIREPGTDEISAITEKLDTLFEGITVVILSDYGKGFVSTEIAQKMIHAANMRNIPVLVDPKGNDVGKYRGAAAITPNNKEFLDLTGLSALPDEAGITEQGKRLCREYSLQRVILTRSEKGISVIDANGKEDFQAEKKEVVDVTGAGDTVVSAIALGIGAGFPIQDCIRTANVAASIVISRFGASQTTPEELRAALCPPEKVCTELEELLQELEKCRANGKKIVFTNGCFDLVHAGHIKSFRQARRFGDILVVGVNSDASVCRLKGPTRPVVTLQYRMELLAALTPVDFVVSFEEDTPQSLIEAIRPDVLVKGMDWKGKPVAGSEFVESYGGRMEFIELEQGLSTTAIVEKIRKQ